MYVYFEAESLDALKDHMEYLTNETQCMFDARDLAFSENGITEMNGRKPCAPVIALHLSVYYVSSVIHTLANLLYSPSSNVCPFHSKTIDDLTGTISAIRH